MSNSALYRMKRSVKIGTFSFVICLALAALLVAANILSGFLPDAVSRFDASGSNLTTVTDQTKSFLKGMKDDVTIYWLVDEGAEDGQLSLFLSRYDETGKHVTVKTVSPSDTEFLTKYGATSLSAGSLIVESAKRFTTVDIRRMYLYTNPLFEVLQSNVSGIMQPMSFDQINSVYEQYGSYIQYMLMMQGLSATTEQIQNLQQIVSFCGEAQLTAALDYVTQEYIPHAYVLTGYGNATVTASMKELLAAMEADELSLKDTQSIPADAGCLILYSPTVDMTVAEANLVKAYLNAGGTLILNTSPEAVETCPNIMSLGADFGLTALPGEVQEGNTAGFKGNPNLLLPAVSGMSASADGSVTAYMPNAHGIATTTVAGVTANPLMTTTETAERVSLADKTTVLGEKGKVNVAAAAQKTVTGADGKSTTAHMVWFGSANAFTETAEKVNSEWNNQFYLYIAASACDSFVSSHSTIQAVSMTQPMLENLTVGWALILGLIFAIVIPAAVMGAGIVIWVARRRR